MKRGTAQFCGYDILIGVLPEILLSFGHVQYQYCDEEEVCKMNNYCVCDMNTGDHIE